VKEQIALNEKKQFVCSMHPQVIGDSPGDCPICGMFLIEKIDEDKNSLDTTLTDVVRPVNESVMASVTTVNPEQLDIPIVIEASGIINYDPRKIQTISARFGGLIERSFVKYQFQHIKKGQKIYEIYCPDIYNERWNYVKLIQAFPDRDDLTTEALNWLNILGLSAGQIDSLKRTVRPEYHLPVYSYAEGYAVSRDYNPEKAFIETANIGLYDGIIVETGTPLFKLIDIKSLVVDLKMRTEDCSFLRNGQKVIITDAVNPDNIYNATLSRIEPLKGGLFQSVKVYITDNERRLMPGKQIKAKIMAGSHNGLWLPKTAVIDLGHRQAVFEMHDNSFVATEVRTGIRTGDMIEIISGIEQDSRVAEKALLLSDSDGFITIR
jgi:Cu(I)/Ag(I) efflux system membrane fusion protein